MNKNKITDWWISKYLDLNSNDLKVEVFINVQ